MTMSKTTLPSSVRVSESEMRIFRSGSSNLPKPFLVAPPVILPQNPKLMARVDAIAAAAMKARALRLPQEPEDAKLTGSTRSLNRRLLGLNLGGSLMRPA
jgi:hypothetical protein